MTNKIFTAFQLLIAAMGIVNVIAGYIGENAWQISTGNWMLLAVSGAVGIKLKENNSNA